MRIPTNTGRLPRRDQEYSRFHRVAYLECDLGQSEFTPGGMVSLNVLEQPVFGEFCVSLLGSCSMTLFA